MKKLLTLSLLSLFASGSVFAAQETMTPRDYYESSGNNKVVKSAAAAVIGVPAGLYGEIRQIVVGNSGDVRY